MDGWRRGATCVSSHHLCLRAGGRQRQQEVGVLRDPAADFQREEDPCSVPVLPESVTVSSAKVSVAPIMAFQSLEFRVSWDIWRGRDKKEKGEQELSVTSQTGVQERRKGLWFIFEVSGRLGGNHRER